VVAFAAALYHDDADVQQTPLFGTGGIDTSICIPKPSDTESKVRDFVGMVLIM
jgi:hypothetical protein